jgi:hypothetical protein
MDLHLHIHVPSEHPPVDLLQGLDKEALAPRLEQDRMLNEAWEELGEAWEELDLHRTLLQLLVEAGLTVHENTVWLTGAGGTRDLRVEVPDVLASLLLAASEPGRDGGSSAAS